jgi:hypothetical protein
MAERDVVLRVRIRTGRPRRSTPREVSAPTLVGSGCPRETLIVRSTSTRRSAHRLFRRLMRLRALGRWFSIAATGGTLTAVEDRAESAAGRRSAGPRSKECRNARAASPGRSTAYLCFRKVSRRRLPGRTRGRDLPDQPERGHRCLRQSAIVGAMPAAGPTSSTRAWLQVRSPRIPGPKGALQDGHVDRRLVEGVSAAVRGPKALCALRWEQKSWPHARESQPPRSNR